MQEKSIDDYWNVDSKRSVSNSLKGFTKIIILKKNLTSDICGLGGDLQTFSRLPDQIMYSQMYVRKLVKPLRIEKYKNGKTRSKNSTMLEDWEEFTLLILMTKITKKLSKMRGEYWKDLWRHPCRAKRKTQTCTTEVAGKQEIAPQKGPKTIYGCVVEAHESTRQRVEACPPKHANVWSF